MSIVIDKSKCIGCKRCRNVCPEVLSRPTKRQSVHQISQGLLGLHLLHKKNVHAYAISFFLGSDIGGMGSKVHTEKNGDILSWLIEKPHGEVIKIDINQKESNKY